MKVTLGAAAAITGASYLVYIFLRSRKWQHDPGKDGDTAKSDGTSKATAALQNKKAEEGSTSSKQEKKDAEVYENLNGHVISEECPSDTMVEAIVKDNDIDIQLPLDMQEVEEKNFVIKQFEDVSAEADSDRNVQQEDQKEGNKTVLSCDQTDSIISEINKSVCDTPDLKSSGSDWNETKVRTELEQNQESWTDKFLDVENLNKDRDIEEEIVSSSVYVKNVAPEEYVMNVAPEDIVENQTDVDITSSELDVANTSQSPIAECESPCLVSHLTENEQTSSPDCSTSQTELDSGVVDNSEEFSTSSVDTDISVSAKNVSVEEEKLEDADVDVSEDVVDKIESSTEREQDETISKVTDCVQNATEESSENVDDENKGENQNLGVENVSPVEKTIEDNVEECVEEENQTSEEMIEGNAAEEDTSNVQENVNGTCKEEDQAALEDNDTSSCIVEPVEMCTPTTPTVSEDLAGHQDSATVEGDISIAKEELLEASKELLDVKETNEIIAEKSLSDCVGLDGQDVESKDTQSVDSHCLSWAAEVQKENIGDQVESCANVSPDLKTNDVICNTKRKRNDSEETVEEAILASGGEQIAKEVEETDSQNSSVVEENNSQDSSVAECNSSTRVKQNSGVDSATTELDSELVSEADSQICDSQSLKSVDSGQGSIVDSGQGSIEIEPETVFKPAAFPVFTQTHYIFYEFEISQSLVGRLIGKKGAFVNKIKATTDATIIVHPHRNRRLKMCSVEGTRAQVDGALAMIREHFPENRYPDVSLEQVSKAPNQPINPTVNTPAMQIELTAGVVAEVRVSAVMSGGEVWVQQPLHPSASALHRLNTCMNLNYGDGSSTPPLPLPIIEGTVCVGEIGGVWMRAQVLGSDETSALVLLLDVGGSVSLPVTSLRQIRYDYMTLPFQASQCLLNGIKPVEDDCWSDTSAAVLEELVSATILFTTVVAYTQDGVPLVNLYRKDNDQYINLNERMVHLGHAQWVSAAVSS